MSPYPSYVCRFCPRTEPEADGGDGWRHLTHYREFNITGLCCQPCYERLAMMSAQEIQAVSTSLAVVYALTGHT